MPVTDTISDYLTRIRNAGTARHSTVVIPKSKIKLAMSRILKDQGYIMDYEVIQDDVQGNIKITLKYYRNVPVIKNIAKVSKPGRRVYSPSDNLPRVNNGLGIAIISTSKGVMTDKDARRQKLGGEVICTIW